MKTPADFYLYQGEGQPVVLGVLRACRKIGAIEHAGRTVILVTLEPAIPPGTLPPGVKTDVIGLSQYGAKPLDRLAPGDIGSAELWEVYDFGEGKLGVGVAPSIGRANIYRIRPALDSKGEVIKAPAAAKQVMNSILNALGAEEKKTKT